MYLQVLFQIGSTSKLLVAYLTFKRLFTSVNALMSNQVRHLREGLSTARMLALVRLLLVMHSGMFLQRRILCKCLVANITILLGTEFNSWGNFSNIRISLTYHLKGLLIECVLSCSLSALLQLNTLSQFGT